MIIVKHISHVGIDSWLQKLLGSGRRVLAPKKTEYGVDFSPVRSGGEIAWEAVQTIQSVKSFLFPKAEEMIRFQVEGEKMQIQESAAPMPETVIFGLRPCDAAGIVSLEAIFHWDTIDTLIKQKRERMTLVGISCKKADEYCFCTSMDGGPGDTAGSDLLLTEMEEGQFLVEVLTPKGEDLIKDFPDLFLSQEARSKESFLARVEHTFGVEKIVHGLVGLFDREETWVEQSLRCIGCGACAFVCPACACFNIEDEGSQLKGRRVRCWDSCGFSLFTLHASGHNPRELQFERWRQRLMHKLSYMPERLKVLGCVGCGRCSRSCPVDMNMHEHLQALAEMLK